MSSLRLAVDVGGTFTDLCIFDEATSRVRVTKVPSTTDPIDGIMASLERGDIDLADVVLLSHGTTVATNALITRRLPRTAMVCTEGFRDVNEIRRSEKEDLWDTYKDVAPPYIPRRDRLTVRERVNATGEVVTPLDEERARKVAQILKRRGFAAVAVCFMNSYINGANERRMREILLESLQEIPIAISSDVNPEIFEHERFSTTSANAVLGPIVGAYCERLSSLLHERGYKSDLLLLHSGGGVMTAKGATRFAARLAGSGIAAGAIASRHIATQCGFPNSIGLDMGGTSCDVSLAFEGQSRITKDWYIEFGHPIRFPSIDLVTIGAGGGSHAWIDAAGSLRNGPQSAGASPGPACYGRGGAVPTNTDANIVLGRLSAELAGGSVTLDHELAEAAIESAIAAPLGLTLHDAADAVLKVANANMADAVRLMSITRGHDPRDFALVAFGGAGALHGAELARELSIPTVIVPPNPGVTSALGCLLVDVQHDLAVSYIRRAADATPSEMEAQFATMEEEAVQHLTVEGVAPDRIILERSVDVMYQGQWRSLGVPVSTPVQSIDAIVEQFHVRHQREYNFRRDGAPTEFYRLNLRAVGLVNKAELTAHELVNSEPEPRSRRAVWFDGVRFEDTPIYWRDSLLPGAQVQGPAVIDQFDSTTVLPPGCVAQVDGYLNLIIRISNPQ